LHAMWRSGEKMPEGCVGDETVTAMREKYEPAGSWFALLSVGVPRYLFPGDVRCRHVYCRAVARSDEWISPVIRGRGAGCPAQNATIDAVERRGMAGNVAGSDHGAADDAVVLAAFHRR